MHECIGYGTQFAAAVEAAVPAAAIGNPYGAYPYGYGGYYGFPMYYRFNRYRYPRHWHRFYR